MTRGIEITVNYLGIQFDVRHVYTHMHAHTPAPAQTVMSYYMASCEDNYGPIITCLPALSAVNLLVIAFNLFPHVDIYLIAFLNFDE